MTNAEFAILSLLNEQPRHGYEIEQVIEERGMRDWTEIGFSSIYYVLNKLEKEGLIESQLLPAAGRGPGRKVYRLTPSGQKLWHEYALQALSQPQTCPRSIQLGLASLPGLSPDETLTALQNYRKGLKEQRAYVLVRWEPQRPLPFYVSAMFEHSLALIDAELTWLERFIERLEKEQSANLR